MSLLHYFQKLDPSSSFSISHHTPPAMKANQLVPLTVLSLLTMSNSCKKESQDVAPDPCSPSIVALVTTPDLDAISTCFTDTSLKIGESKKQIITSTAQLGTAFVCSNPPTIDFDRFTLLAGQTKLAYDSRVISQQVIQSCKNYKYVVKIKQGMGATITTPTYQALIPKIDKDATIDFEVQIIP